MFWFFGWESCGIFAPWAGIQPTSHELEGEVLTTGLPGSPTIFYWAELDKEKQTVQQEQKS